MRSAFLLLCLAFLVHGVTAQGVLPTPSPTNVSDTDALAKALSLRSTVEMEKALAAFIDQYPDSDKMVSARTSLASLRVNIAEERFMAGDSSAAEIFRKAVEDAPQPIPDKLFSDMLSRIPGRLYLGGDWQGAYRVAEALEIKIQDNSAQLITLVGFYLSVEDGERSAILSGRAIKIDERSAAAFSALGLAKRLTFEFDEAETAFAKAVELDPASSGAKRGLAEIKRTMGKYREAAALYAELLEEDPEDISSFTGKLLSELEFGDRARVEDELDVALEKNPQNVQLLAGAAYWYASRGYADKALDFADLALVIEPRYVWAHIARARGLMLQNKPMEAEKVLLVARSIANFPSLEYEIALARYDVGLYREAGEDLSKYFSIRNGKLVTKLGGRIEREADDFISLTGLENRASIFISQKAENDVRSQKLKDLLQMIADINSEDKANAAASARRFAAGPDAMKLHRHLYAAEVLIEKNIEHDTALALTQEAVPYSEAASKEQFAAMATMASELYDVRRSAFINGEYMEQPSVPRQTILLIIRGRIEEMTGIVLHSAGKSSEAAVRFNRALSILPEKSAWSRSANWRLGLIEREKGNEERALGYFINSYDINRPDIVKYAMIESIYTKLKGSNDDLQQLIGPSPIPRQLATDQKIETVVPIGGEDKIVPESKIEETEKTEEEKVSEQKEKAEVLPGEEKKETETEKEAQAGEKTKSAFEPIIIGIKRPENEKPSEVESTDKENTEPMADLPTGNQRARLIADREVNADTKERCTINSSQENVILRRNGGSIGILAGLDGEPGALEITSDNPEDIMVTIEKDPAVVTTRTFFVISSISLATGEFEVKLKAECGAKVIKVTVR